MTGSQGQDTGEALALAELADLIHKAIDPHGVEAACPEDGKGFVACWEAAQAVLAAGYVAPADHQRALAAERERMLQEAAEQAERDAEHCPAGCNTSTCRDANLTTSAWLRDRAAIARGNPHTPPEEEA